MTGRFPLSGPTKLSYQLGHRILPVTLLFYTSEAVTETIPLCTELKAKLRTLVKILLTVNLAIWFFSKCGTKQYRETPIIWQKRSSLASIFFCGKTDAQRN